MHMTRRVLLAVIDGLGAEPLRRAMEDGHAPCISELVACGARHDEAISPFPSLTPVCLSTIITGGLPHQHRIPSLGWYNRGEHRFVEYGSSFAAAAVEGRGRTIEDVILNLNHVHLAEEPHTLFERFQDDGREAASINFLLWRGRTRHTMKHDYGPVKRIGRRQGVHAVYGPDHLYFGELYGKTRPMLPQIGIKRPRDWGAAHIARWLLRNTSTEFVLLYLGQHDVASHKLGPEETQRAIRIADRALGRVVDAMGGAERFLSEFGLVVCADHGQTTVTRSERIEQVFDDITLFQGSRARGADRAELAVVPSNRFAMTYRVHERSPSDDWVAERALETQGVDIAAYADGEEMVVRSASRGTLRVRRCDVAGVRGGYHTERSRVAGEPDRWELHGDLDVLDLHVDGDVIVGGAYPDALMRLWSAVHCVNTGDVLISAAAGTEFEDIGGCSHDGGSHGSLLAGDSVAPLITSGIDLPDKPAWWRLADIAGLVASHAELPAARSAVPVQ
jgi:hypothetical protein